MYLDHQQIETLSKYFGDASKLLVGSVVIGFFIPNEAEPLSLPVFFSGIFAALSFLYISIALARK
ncbi:MAG: hypothetical protein A3J10_03205 [Candidatus Sungbacteria bacterium RIFCSPLOWO2_02_FULL_54_10]|uniref:Uncharacterized protein n=2 Tax=Candidatus Sungiibacteriota TaxID=1817917 RepID=A0A1G2L781_9BACT|nr:MAG: hypothetical protein A2679_03765 [Candidatus Sungbacteria bacterium RIFCSPHIGHO2_01_FULL_54_26]OHA02591.1 MAG: hypothetical protein A3C92_03025 [Candidatus Sungbacteria bacterium RIFCSPHIGHO2_02_FULL_53_17]OHA07390.1 MAG: hypothetical protein A3B34_02960 [Candidatus Sungbacteria bacterium RIFCSPLOWO2_01_FULL_54_21]OHA13970.1 MAG: hypothetical protein A3J10_03205 [Candidatus Sungbacteria bacterium RIFCSPLOWO2_02_FULL_54_10]